MPAALQRDMPARASGRVAIESRRAAWRTGDAPAGERHAKVAFAVAGDEQAGGAVRSRRQRQAPGRGRRQGATLGQGRAQGPALQPLLQRPGEIARAPYPRHQQCRGVDSEAGEAGAVGRAEFARGVLGKDPQKRHGPCLCTLPAPGERQRESKRRPAVGIGAGADLVQSARVQSALGKGAVDFAGAEGPARFAGQRGRR